MPVEADIVVPVPDSGVPAAIGYAQQADLPFELGIIRNHYVGRTFIQPTDSIRHMGVKLKHNANRHSLEGKRVILVDDSIVRGTTSQKIVQMVREAGAKEVHMRIASPPTISSCYYGVDTPETNKLLASRMSVEEMAEFIRVDSLGFLSIDGLYRAVGESARDAEQPQFCDACFTGAYPTRLLDRDGTDNVRQLVDPRRRQLTEFTSCHGHDTRPFRPPCPGDRRIARHRPRDRPADGRARRACHRGGTHGRRT
jgi:amidophosphoribosyltransferase